MTDKGNNPISLGMTKRSDLQAIRGIALTFVLLYHAKKSYIPNGYLGVDIFFVLSGFVVTPLMLKILDTESIPKSRQNLLHFYKKRFLRLIPAIGASLLLLFPAIFLLSPIEDLDSIYRQALSTLYGFGNFGAYKYSGDYFTPLLNPFIHTWSLAIEEQIYLFLPLIFIFMIVKHRITKSPSDIFVLITILSFTVFIFPKILFGLYNIVGFHDFRVANFYSPIARMWQFSLGGLAVSLSTSKYISRKYQAMSLGLLVMLITIPVSISDTLRSITVSILVVIVIISYGMDIVSNQIKSPLCWLGNRSYSIYLVHMPIIYLAKNSPVFGGESKSRFLQTLIALILSVVLGSLLYTKCEEKFRAPRNDSIIKKSVLKVGILFILTPSLILGIAIHFEKTIAQLQGLPIPDKLEPWNWDPNCVFFSTIKNIQNEPCAYGDPNLKRSVFLIGDSHSASLSRAVIQLSNKLEARTYVFTFSGCRFFLSNNALPLNYTISEISRKCIAHNLRIKRFIQLKNPNLVIYSQRSSSIYLDPNTAATRLSYNNLIIKNLMSLPNSKKNLIVIGSGPELQTGKSILQVLSSTKVKYSQIPFYDNQYWKSKSISLRFHYIDTIKIFCPNMSCHNSSDGHYLFQDKDHFSYNGALLVMKNLHSIANQILTDKLP